MTEALFRLAPGLAGICLLRLVFALLDPIEYAIRKTGVV